MKKVVNLVLVIILLVAGLFILTGCSESKKEESKKNENIKEYVIDATYGGKFTFEFQDDLGYEVEEGTNKLVFTHKENKSTISIYTMDTGKIGILMKEKDFASSAYEGYKNIEIAGHEAYTINRKSNYDVTYGILLDKDEREFEKNYKYYGVKIVVSKNALKLDEFDPAAFVQTEAFQHLLNSIKVTQAENKAE